MAAPLHHKALDRSDDAGVVMGALVTLAGIFHLHQRLGISAEDLVVAMGAVFTLGAFVRGRLEKRRRTDAPQSAPTRFEGFWSAKYGRSLTPDDPEYQAAIQLGLIEVDREADTQ